jgi:uncharacterized protein
MIIGTVTQLWRYPVKSMGGERLSAANLSWRGIPGDRGWAVYDETRKGITNAKRLPALRLCRAHYLNEPVAGESAPPALITFPEKTAVATTAPDAALKLSEWVGRAVSLRSLGPAGSGTDPRVTNAGASPEEIRELMGIMPDEPEPDFSAFPPERLRQLREGNFFDAHALHLITRTTLRTLSRLAPESNWDERRFRANLLVETGDAEDYPEQRWLGRRLRVGDALVEVVTGCPRCVMVTQQDDDLPQDKRIMRTLVRETRHTAGVYANVVAAGNVKAGDAIELLD